MILITPDQLSKDALRGVVEEFILREGTDYGLHEVSLEGKIREVMSQLNAKTIVITFDPSSENCTLLTSQDFQKLGQHDTIDTRSHD